MCRVWSSVLWVQGFHLVSALCTEALTSGKTRFHFLCLGRTPSGPREMLLEQFSTDHFHSPRAQFGGRVLAVGSGSDADVYKRLV